MCRTGSKPFIIWTVRGDRATLNSGKGVLNGKVICSQRLRSTDKAVQEKVAALQSYINENFYTCSNDILKGLGEMYVCDDRFKKNIDRVSGEGTAEFVREAIFIYCDK